MGGDVVEVRYAVVIQSNALAIVHDSQIVLALFASAHDGDVAGVGIDGVLDELRDRLQRAVLREGDDGDGVPVVADAQLAAVPRT